VARVEALIRPVRDTDAAALAGVMRPEDAAEVLASGGWSPLQGICGSLEISSVKFAVDIDGDLAALGGIADGPRWTLLGGPSYGVVWLLTGSAVARHPGAFWRASVVVLQRLLELQPVLWNAIDARYVAALRWARRLGAEVQPAIPWGESGLPFHPVVWRRSSCATP
jgi:hypothetical protein